MMTYCCFTGLLLFRNSIKHTVRNTNILDSISTHINFWQGPKLITASGRSDDPLHTNIHPDINVGQLAIERFSVLEFDQDR